MNDIVKRLNDRRLTVLAEARSLAELSTEENRAMTAEEQGQWDGLNNELDQIEKRMRGMAEQEKRSKETASLFENIQAQPHRSGADPVKSAAELPSWVQ